MSFPNQANHAEPVVSSLDPLHKSVKERFFQSFLFEVIAVALCASVGSWLLGYPLMQMGALTLMISTLAMVWNMVFNALFDRAQVRLGFQRGVLARVVQAGLFEIGLIAAVVPLAAWWLRISLWEALVLDIGIAMFFLPYSFAYNWTYDTVRARILARRGVASNSAAATSAAQPQTR